MRAAAAPGSIDEANALYLEAKESLIRRFTAAGIGSARELVDDVIKLVIFMQEINDRTLSRSYRMVRWETRPAAPPPAGGSSEPGGER